MSQDHNPWRDKYRAALAQQEHLEKTLSAQQALLHRTVMTLGNAAEGQDNEIDKRLSAIRSSLKNNDVGGFDRMIKSMDRIIEEASKRQQKRWSEVNKGLAHIAEQLHTIKQSGDSGSAIKRFKKSIPKGPLLPATLKRLLEDFSHLQNQVHQEAISDGSISKPGLLSSLLSRKEKDNDELQALAPTHAAKEPAAEAMWEAVEDDDAYSLVAELVEDNTPRYRERRIPEALIPEATMERTVHEPAFSKISDRVTIILVELLDQFPIVPCVEKKAVKARERIDKGLNWYELAPTLEDIRDFVIQAYMGADDNYRLYLKNVYDELGEITTALGLAIETEQEQRKTMDTLHHNLNDSVHHITQALIENEEMSALKSAVNTQVKSIQSALKESRSQPKTQGESLSSQLGSLIERVKEMEKQEADVREQLEQERLRAVTDSLTGLPNREAYSERIHEEMTRWKRYRHPLCMAIIDIDFFKKINDNYGHATGDKVLKAVSSAVSQRLREVDFMARFGGEEFVMILPETSRDDALTMLNRIRERLSKAQMRSKDSKFTVTVSIGIAEFGNDDTAEEVFERADQALYEAKENGRNQCRLG